MNIKLKQMKTKCTFFILTFTLLTIQAQDKVWEKNLKEQLYEVGWIEQTNDGTVIAAGAKGLMALNNNTGEVLWHKTDLKSIDRNTFLNIGQLPLFYVEYVPIVGKKRGLLINSYNGEIVFDTKDQEYRIKDFTLLPQKKMILFELVKDNNRYLLSFDLKTWTENWVADLGKRKSGLIKRLLSNSFIHHKPQFDNQDHMIIGTEDEIFCINNLNGSIVWQQETDNDIKALVYSEINNNLYLGVKKSNRLMILDPTSGEDITLGKLKLRGYMIDLVKGSGDDLIMVETEGFNIIDPKTNEFRWKKSFKIDPITEVIPYGNDYIAIGKSEKDGVIARVSSEGKKIWEASVNGYAYYMSLTEKGVLYISTERSNILDYQKGKDVWKKDIKFRSIPAVTYDTDAKKVILFENKNAYKFDLDSGELEQFADNIDLKKVSRKTPLQAEYLSAEGYFIYSDQHVSLLSTEGTLKYTEFYEPPSSSNALFALGNLAGAYFGIDLDIEGSLENIKMLTDLSNGVYTETLDQNGVNTHTTTSFGIYSGPNVNAMEPIFEITKSRYFNSRKTRDYQFMVTKIKSDNAPTKHAIYMINKPSGKIEKQIELLDKTPDYLVDDVDKRVFVNQNNHLITCYGF